MLAQIPTLTSLHKCITGIRWHRLAPGLPHFCPMSAAPRSLMIDWVQQPLPAAAASNSIHQPWKGQPLPRTHNAHAWNVSGIGLSYMFI